MDPMELEIAKLQREYINTFADKEKELRQLAGASPPNAAVLAKALHKIAGSGGTYRMQALTACCRALERALLADRVQLPAHGPTVEAWFSFFTMARTSYEKLCAQPAGDADAEKWHAAVARVDGALMQLWGKFADSQPTLAAAEEAA
jgi:HPt (histidine-containing phosphotransfer) domain-containing protein